MKIMIPSEKAKILEENINLNEENNKLEIGNNLEVDGNLEVNGYVRQNTANYELNLRNSLIAGGSYDTYFKSDTFYTAFKEINGVLWFILSGNGKTKEASANMLMPIPIPESFKEVYYPHIYRADGTNLTQETDDSHHIASDTFYGQNSGVAKTGISVLQSNRGANQDLALRIYNLGDLSDDGNLFIDIRIPLLII